MTTTECRICESTRVVPVLDKRIERRMRPGNCYRQYCFGCSSWLPMTSADHFESSLHPHVLPVGGDPDDPDNVIPLEDYQYGPELGELVDDVVRRRYDQFDRDADVAPTSAVPVSDGGEEFADATQRVPPADAVDTPEVRGVPPVPDDVPAELSDDHSNTFDCPRCGRLQSGYPESCGSCEAEYDW